MKRRDTTKGKRLGDVLRAWRVEKDWTLQQVSDRTAAPGPRVDWSQLSKMERGLAEPQLDVYERVAVALGRTLAALLATAFPPKGRRPLPRRQAARLVRSPRHHEESISGPKP
jgi:transcriptional regulator with XRE-family HTH domain